MRTKIFIDSFSRKGNLKISIKVMTKKTKTNTHVTFFYLNGRHLPVIHAEVFTKISQKQEVLDMVLN